MRRFVATASLVALCAGVVEAAPQFLGFTCGPAIVDARKNDVEVTCAARVLDKSSEIVSAIAQVTSPSGKHVIPLYFDAQKSFGLGAVTGINIGAKFVVPKNAEPGLWQITFDGPYQLAVTNKKGETTKVSRDQAGGSSGIQPWVKVYSNDDQSPPFIKDITCDSPLMQNNTFLQGIPVVCQFEATDTGSGVNFVRANFISPSGKTIITLSANTATNLVSGSGDDVTLKATEPGYPGMEPGRWKMLMSAPFAPYVEDHNKNGFTYEGLDPEKFFTRAWFDVYSNPDTEPPVVQKFTCSATQAVVPFNGTEEYGCQLVVQDDASGFAYGELALDSPARDQTVVLRFDPNSRSVLFPRGGIYSPTVKFDYNMPGGMWTANAAGLQIWDMAGNKLQLTPKDLNENKFGSYILVTKGLQPANVKPEAPAAADRSWVVGTIVGCVVGFTVLVGLAALWRRYKLQGGAAAGAPAAAPAGASST